MSKMRLADMSVPAAERGRRRRTTPRKPKRPPAQLGHAIGAKADKHRRDMSRKQPRPDKKNPGLG